MNWNTIYITGNGNFWDEVNKKLSQSDLNFLPGSIEKLEENRFQGLYWVGDKTELRPFKLAIGGNLVWKYRLNFFRELDQIKLGEETESDSSFSDKESAMIKSMRSKNPIAA